jgi:hypothetical protein
MTDPHDGAGPEVFLADTAAVSFLDRAVRIYRRIGPHTPYACFGVLVGRIDDDHAHVERIEFGRNVRASDRTATREFSEVIAPCFGAAYDNPHRGYWCDSTDLLWIARHAEADGLDILGSAHLHPDWHHIAAPGTWSAPLTERPTPMDAYLFASTGWPVNLICYLERYHGTLHHTWAAWTPGPADPSSNRCRQLPVRQTVPARSRQPELTPTQMTGLR